MTMATTERIVRFSDEDSALAWLMQAARDRVGIQLGPHKGAMVRARLGKRLRALNTDCIAYARLVQESLPEWRHFVDLITTNHTYWWRESDHFTDLAQRVLVPMRDRFAPRLRIWCAGSATGEEAYSIALSVVMHLGETPTMDAAILATDISTRALERARAGLYPESRVEQLPPVERSRALDLIDPHGRMYQVREPLRRLVHFARLNLLDAWSMNGPFDVIFCRNVMIYFDKDIQQSLVARFGEMLRPGGVLYLGHSESLTRIKHHLRAEGTSIYIKP